MAAANKLQKIANEKGITVKALVIEAVEREGSIVGAAQSIRVNPNTISNALKRFGLKVETRQSARLVPNDSPETPCKEGERNN